MRTSTLAIRAFLFTVLGILAVGCGETSTDPPSKSTGTIVGSMNLFNEWGQEVTDRSGILAKLRYHDISATTDAKGRFELTGVPIGVYVVEFSKDGYVPNTSSQFQFVGVDTLLIGTEHLFAIAGQRTFTLSDPEITGQGTTFTASVDPEGIPTYFSLTISRQSGAKIEDASTYVKAGRYDYAVVDTETITYRDYHLTALGLEPGEQVYMIAWTTNSFGISNGLRSNEISFVVQ